MGLMRGCKKGVELTRSLSPRSQRIAITILMDRLVGRGCERWWNELAEKRRKAYLFYVLVLLMIVYLINQMDRFILGIASRRISIDLEYGSLGCYANDSHHNETCNDSCVTYDDELRCRRQKCVDVDKQTSSIGLR